MRDRLAAGLMAMVAACSPRPVEPKREPMDSVVTENEFELWSLARTASVIIARTDDAGPSPGVWSGHFTASQRLAVTVEETVCGPPRSGRVVIEVALVEGTRLVDRSPALAPWLVTSGARVIWFLAGERPVDGDLGAFAAEPDTEARIRALCGARMPSGVPAVVHELAALAAADGRIGARFAPPLTGVLDVQDAAGGPLARLTVAAGVLRMFSGVRMARVAPSRAPDVTVRASASQLAAALSGAARLDALVVAGGHPELLRALAGAAEVIHADAGLRARVQRAAAP